MSSRACIGAAPEARQFFTLGARYSIEPEASFTALLDDCVCLFEAGLAALAQTDTSTVQFAGFYLLQQAHGVLGAATCAQFDGGATQGHELFAMGLTYSIEPGASLAMLMSDCACLFGAGLASLELTELTVPQRAGVYLLQQAHGVFLAADAVRQAQAGIAGPHQHSTPAHPPQ